MIVIVKIFLFIFLLYLINYFLFRIACKAWASENVLDASLGLEPKWLDVWALIIGLHLCITIILGVVCAFWFIFLHL
ncbi:MAG TPA: hypothetical protein DCL29_05395 [Eubacterium sp.]|nr:hypothetical protein [Eubacterium sp.]